jgi:hypothetical protein
MRRRLAAGLIVTACCAPGPARAYPDPWDETPVVIIPPEPKGPAMLDAIKNLFTGLSWSTIILLALVAWYVARHGVPATWSLLSSSWAKLQGWWQAGVNDVKQVQTALAGDVAILKNDVEAIKAHLGITPPPAAPTAPTHPGA